MTAAQVAQLIYQGANPGHFMILNHKMGRQTYPLKHYLPTMSYMNMLKEKMAKFRPAHKP
jgi:hypothetical protein